MKKKILIVDNDERTRVMLSSVFSSEGYQVFSASSGEDALKLLKKKLIPVMFLDMRLPDISGLELSKLIREEYPETCIYAMTNDTKLFKKAERHEHGLDDFFLKPVDIEVFYKAAKYGFQKIKG
jgi:DNA-binding response OmpR family regulator